MAYRKSYGASAKRKTTTKRATGRRRAASSPQTVRLVIEHVNTSAVSRPDIANMQVVDSAKPKRAKF